MLRTLLVIANLVTFLFIGEFYLALHQVFVVRKINSRIFFEQFRKIYNFNFRRELNLDLRWELRIVNIIWTSISPKSSVIKINSLILLNEIISKVGKVLSWKFKPAKMILDRNLLYQIQANFTNLTRMKITQFQAYRIILFLKQNSSISSSHSILIVLLGFILFLNLGIDFLAVKFYWKTVKSDRT